MFKSYFPRPALFFSSAAIWSLIAIFAWFGFADDLPSRWPALHAAMQQPLPTTAAALAAQRGYLPVRVPLLKRVGAVAPQHVCVFDALVWIDGVPVAAVRPADRLGRPLPSWPQCRQLRPGELFLLSVTNPASFDSRYFGPVSASAVIGVARPIWLEAHP